MFGFGKKAKEEVKQELYAVCDGKVINCEEIQDEVFSQKILGDGLAVIPNGATAVLSPCDGKVVDVQDTLHAYGIESDDGLEILVHIGINTVELGGEGFSAKVKPGSKVKAGQVLCDVDFDLIRSKGYPDSVVMLVTSMDAVKSIAVKAGECKAGETVLTYEK